MQAAFGFKSHSGWAAMVAVGTGDNGAVILDRRRIDLVEPGDDWAKAPYHSAEHLERREADKVVSDGIRSAYQVAARQMREAVSRMRKMTYAVNACGVLVPAPMPEWSTQQILSVHFRMHKAEGVLFPDALCRAALKCGLRLVAIPEKQLGEIVKISLSTSEEELPEIIERFGRFVGPPWRKDQKNAAIAAMIALSEFEIPQNNWIEGRSV